MRLSSYRRIYDQDYQGPNQELIKQLATPLNGAFTELYNLGNNNITFGDNINCTISSFNITTDSNGTPLNTTQFKLADYQTTLSGLFVINVVGTGTNADFPMGGVQVSFKKSNNYVIINNVTGLKSSIGYKITVIALG